MSYEQISQETYQDKMIKYDTYIKKYQSRKDSIKYSQFIEMSWYLFIPLILFIFALFLLLSGEYRETIATNKSQYVNLSEPRCINHACNKFYDIYESWEVKSWEGKTYFCDTIFNSPFMTMAEVAPYQNKSHTQTIYVAYVSTDIKPNCLVQYNMYSANTTWIIIYVILSIIGVNILHLLYYHINDNICSWYIRHYEDKKRAEVKDEEIEIGLYVFK